VLPRIAHIAQRVSEIERLLARVTDTPPNAADGAFAQALQRGYALTLAGAQGTPAKLRATFGDGQLDDLVSQISAKYGVDADLVHAVIKVESDYDPNCVSSAGASGLMQLMPSTARHLGVEDILNPAENIDGGVRYLKQQLDRFGSVELALAAYNAGPGAVAQHNGIPPYRETQAYVPRVLQYYNSRRAAHTQSAQPSWTPTSLGNPTAASGSTRPRAAAVSATPYMLAMAPVNDTAATPGAIATTATIASTDSPAPLFVRSQQTARAPEIISDVQTALAQSTAVRQTAVSEPGGSLPAPSQIDVDAGVQAVAPQRTNAAIREDAQPAITTTESRPTVVVATNPASFAPADAQSETSASRPSVRATLPQVDATTGNTIARQIDQALRVGSGTQTPNVDDPRPTQSNTTASVAMDARTAALGSASTDTGVMARVQPTAPVVGGAAAVAQQSLAVAAAPPTDLPVAAVPASVAPAQTSEAPVAERSAWQPVPTPIAQIADAGLHAELLTQAVVDQAPVRPGAAVVETDPAQIVLRALDELPVPVMQTVANASVRQLSPQNSAGRGASTSTPMDATVQQREQTLPAVLESLSSSVAVRASEPVATSGSEPMATMKTAVTLDTMRATATVAGDTAPLTDDVLLPKLPPSTASRGRVTEIIPSGADDIDAAGTPETTAGRGISFDLTQSVASQVAGAVSSKIDASVVSRQIAAGGSQIADSGNEVTVQRSTQAPPTAVAAGADVQEAVTIELSPPELGRVRIAFELRGSEARVNVNAEYAATASHLDQGFRALQSRFEDMGIRLTHLAVSCDASSDFQQGPGQHGQAGHDQPSPASPWHVAWHESETGDSEGVESGRQQIRQTARVAPDGDTPESARRAAIIDMMG